MDLFLLVRGFLLGLSVAAAVGPMAILCMRRTLIQGQLAGLVTGLGIASADGFYALVAAFGLTIVSEALTGQRVWLELIGGGFLCVIGLQIVRSVPASNTVDTVPVRDILTAYLSGFVLTLANPMTILFFAGLFAGLGLASTSSYEAGIVLVVGVFLGSMSWWLFFTGVVRAIRGRLTDTLLRRVNVLAGGVIFAFGVIAIVSLVL